MLFLESPRRKPRQAFCVATTEMSASHCFVKRNTGSTLQLLPIKQGERFPSVFCFFGQPSIDVHVRTLANRAGVRLSLHMQMASGVDWCLLSQFIIFCACLELFPGILPRDRDPDPWELASMLVQLVDGNCLESSSPWTWTWSAELDGWTPDPVQSVCICSPNLDNTWKHTAEC